MIRSGADEWRGQVKLRGQAFDMAIQHECSRSQCAPPERCLLLRPRLGHVKGDERSALRGPAFATCEQERTANLVDEAAGCEVACRFSSLRRRAVEQQRAAAERGLPLP